MKADEAFKVGDVVVVRPEVAVTSESDHYDFSAWARTRMEVTGIDRYFVTTRALDERPDREWILRTHKPRSGDPQNVHMSWHFNDLVLHG